MATDIGMTANRKFQLTLFVIRLTVGVVILAHGVQKLFGWFGGYGFDGTMNFFTGTIGLPYFAGIIIILLETFGMLALIVGIMGRMISIGVILIMLGAILTTHGSVGFYMNWYGTLPGEGFEYHLLVIALAGATVVNGTGAFSLDQVIWRRRKHVADHSNAMA